MNRYNNEINPKTNKEFGCDFLNGNWCNLPKYKICCNKLKVKNGGNICKLFSTDTQIK